jgi:hypothetical protein
MIVLAMKLIFLLMMGLWVQQVVAQDKWLVYLNKKPVLETQEESEEKNQVLIKASALKNKNVFTITYIEASKQKGWSRSMMLFDSTDKELKRVKGNKITYSNASLLLLLKKYKSLHVYTWSLPNDPAMKERIRVRRVHLCTLVLD